MTLRPALACLLTMAGFCLAACDRMPSQDAALSTRPEVCANSTNGPDLSVERAAEVKALGAHADTAKRDRDTLSLSYQGKVIATVKACDSFYAGSVHLLNSKSRVVEAYDVFVTGMNQSVIVDHDGTPFLFEGAVVASPDGRYVASGEAHQDYMNAPLTVTDWMSPVHSQVEFAVSCSPKAWTAAGLAAECDRLDPSQVVSDAVITAAAEGWVLHETKLKILAEDARQPQATHISGALRTYMSEVVWPETNIDWIDLGIYHPLKGAAVPRRLPDTQIALADPQTGKLESHALAMSSDAYSYSLQLDGRKEYDMGINPIASPDGRFIFTSSLNTVLLDWTRRTEIVFDGDIYCIDGKWLSAKELQAWCYGADDITAHYVEARVIRAKDGAWVYRELAPVRRTVAHTWQSYTAKGFVPRKVIGHDGREMVTGLVVAKIIA